MNEGESIAWRKVKVIYRRLVTLILQNLAYFAPWPFRPYLHRARGVRIGRNVFIGSLVVLDDAYPEFITIEDNVQISAGARVIAHDSSFKNVFQGKIPIYIGPVLIRQNAYVGSGATILPGVTIGESAVVGAGALIISDVPPKTVVVGVPARPIGTIDKKVERFLSKRGLYLWRYYEKPRRLTKNDISKIKKDLESLN